MKKGISLVALIITIIVLIILTAAVVITGVNTPQNAQLAVFLNNITTVQEAVNIKMLNNMAKYATTDGDLEKYKWVGVIQGYTEANAENNDALPESVLQIDGKDVLSIDESLKNELSINEDELAKYFVMSTGQVYYEGFEYNGIIYYNKDSIVTATQGEENNETENNIADGIVINNLSADLDTFSTKIDVSFDVLRYYYRLNGGEWLPEGGTLDHNFTIDNLDSETAYTIELKAVDSLGTEIISNVYQTTTLNQATNGLYCVQKGVNSPKLDTGMTAVYWDANGNEIRQYNDEVLNLNFVYNDWYDYASYKDELGNDKLFNTDNTTSKWANAVTDDGSYWVWIPRYAYSIGTGYHTNISSPIEIEFMKGTTSETALGRTTFQNELGQENWNIHPAFSYNDGTENILPGIWVAKYEMSNNGTKAVSVPGVNSWRSITIANCFTNSLSINPGLQSHLIRNSEWGAVAYLAQSKYGRNGIEVGMNSSNFITGVSLTQSTTGNRYGVFDMNGGAWEYAAAGLSASVSNTFGSANAKYYDAYTSYGDRYGDAVYETSTSTAGSTSWYSDYSTFITSSYPFFARGGSYSDASISGLFSFSYYSYEGYSSISFRSVLWGAP
ncbi:MAG: hypothetical protein PHH22_01745 [Clostridia bacterium]|nr:hypothetical protein [Clostridia bacterium]